MSWYTEQNQKNRSVIQQSSEEQEFEIREFFNERAAIMEFDGEIPRKVAERYAEAETIRKFGVGALDAISGEKKE